MIRFKVDTENDLLWLHHKIGNNGDIVLMSTKRNKYLIKRIDVYTPDLSAIEVCNNYCIMSAIPEIRSLYGELCNYLFDIIITFRNECKLNMGMKSVFTLMRGELARSSMFMMSFYYHNRIRTRL